MRSHSVLRLFDLLTDPRMPHLALVKKLRERKFERIVKEAKPDAGLKLFVATTYDVEREYGSYRIEDAETSVPAFLNAAPDFSKATFFVEGCLIVKYAENLRRLVRRGGEIGLHGHDHELWGRPQWYISEKPLSREEKSQLLQESVRVFREVGLGPPTCFRAPNLAGDDSLMPLLIKFGFRVDSSLPSHRGIAPVPRFYGDKNNLVSIPVTADPRPSTRGGRIAFLHYRVFNLRTILEMTETEIVQYISSIALLQRTLGFSPHVVMLAHSWEFFPPRVKRRQFAYCSEANSGFLHDFHQTLSTNFDVEYVSIGGLGEILRTRADTA